MTERGVGIRQRLRQRGRKQTPSPSLARNWRQRVNKMFWKTAAKVANRQEREQPAISTAWRALAPPLCKGLEHGARAESRLCGRPRDEPGLVTVWGSLSGIPADLAWMERGEMHLQPSVPRWGQTSTCGCRSLVILLALLCQSSPPRDSNFRF